MSTNWYSPRVERIIKRILDGSLNNVVNKDRFISMCNFIDHNLKTAAKPIYLPQDGEKSEIKMMQVLSCNCYSESLDRYYDNDKEIATIIMNILLLYGYISIFVNKYLNKRDAATGLTLYGGDFDEWIDNEPQLYFINDNNEKVIVYFDISIDYCTHLWGTNKALLNAVLDIEYIAHNNWKHTDIPIADVGDNLFKYL